MLADDPLARPPAADVDPSVVGVTHELVPAPFHSQSRSSSMTLDSSGESGEPCGVPSSLASKPASHDARLQVARISLSTCLSCTSSATLAIRASC